MAEIIPASGSFRVIDISRELSPATARYPGTPPVTFEPYRRPGGWGLQTLITTLTHGATHVDAQTHLNQGGLTISDYPLDVFIGRCKVFDVSHRPDGGIVPADFHGKVQRGERVLFRTRNSGNIGPDFVPDYAGVTGDAAIALQEVGVALVGIDSLSIPLPGEDNTAHEALLNYGIPILEGLDLHEVPAGQYFLFAAPIKYPGLDGAPTRAVLLDFSGQEVS